MTLGVSFQLSACVGSWLLQPLYMPQHVTLLYEPRNPIIPHWSSSQMN